MKGVIHWLKKPLRPRKPAQEGLEYCLMCHGKGYRNDFVQYYICPFCKGHKEIDWIEVTRNGTQKDYIPVNVVVREWDKIISTAILWWCIAANTNYNIYIACAAIAIVLISLKFYIRQITLETIRMD